MANDGRIKGPLYVQFVMSVKKRDACGQTDFSTSTSKPSTALAPVAQWCAAGVGPAQIAVNEWAVSKGGHTRTGLEDNIRLDRKHPSAIKRGLS